MTVRIFRTSGAKAIDLIFAEHLAMLSVIEQETMQRAMMNSHTLFVGTDEDRVLAVWGFISPTLLSDTAYLWLFETKHLTAHTFVLIRHSQRIIHAMLEEFPTIHGHGRVGATRSLRWLRWLGAEFGEPQGGFLPFTIRADKWPQDSALRA